MSDNHIQDSKSDNKMLNQSAFYSVSLYLRMLFKLIGGIVVAKLLGPALYGLRNAFDLVIQYDRYSDLGTFPAMVREVPYHRGAKNDEKANQILSSTFGVNILYSLILGMILILVSLYLKKIELEQEYIDFVFFLGLLIVTNKIKLFFSNQLVIDQKVFLLSRVEMLYGFINALLVVAFVYYLGFRGLFIGLIIADLIYIGYILFDIKKFPSVWMSFPLIWELLKIGFPMMIILLLLTLLQSADRIIIILMLSEEELGLFGIATVAIGIIYVIPGAINSVIMPRLMEKLGKTKDIFKIKNYFNVPTILLAYSLPFLLSSIYFSIHLPIQYFLPKYLISIGVVQILTWGLFFATLTTFAISVCYAINKQLSIVYIIIPAVLLNFAINYFFIRLGTGITGVAFGAGISYLIFCTVLCWFTLKQFNAKIGDIILFLFLSYAPFLYSILLIFLIEKFLVFSTFGFWSDVIYTSINLSIFFLVYSLIFFFVRKNIAFTKLFENVPVLKKVAQIFAK